jgi:hypothetical protein
VRRRVVGTPRIAGWALLLLGGCATAIRTAPARLSVPPRDLVLPAEL